MATTTGARLSRQFASGVVRGSNYPRSRLHREADARTRTGDPFITSEVLYQLSYVGGGGNGSEVANHPFRRRTMHRSGDASASRLRLSPARGPRSLGAAAIATAPPDK